MANAARVREPSPKSNAVVAVIRVPRLKQVSVSKRETSSSKSDGLDAFDTEAAGRLERIGQPRAPELVDVGSPQRRRWQVVSLGVAGIAVALASMAFSGGWADRVFAVTPKPASLTLNTTPTGALVLINGEAKGATPLLLELAAGTYQVQLTSPLGQERTLDVTLQEGQSVVQQIEWAEAPAPVAVTSGALHVQTDPPGQAVFIDDVRRGVSPLTISDLSTGEHRLVVTSDAGSYRRAIAITAGQTLSVVVAPHAPAVSAGWLRVASPVLLQLRAAGDLIGNTENDRVMLPAGQHDIEMRNDALGFVRTQRVTVAAGRTSEVRVPLPNGLLSINAVPWAQVWLDGEPLGDTPLANIERPIGNYRVTLRHPQLGERQATVTVSLKETARLGVDMRQPQ